MTSGWTDAPVARHSYASARRYVASLRVLTADKRLSTAVSEVVIVDLSPVFLRGDCNDDGAVDISDAVCTLDWLFGGPAAVGCAAALNADGDAGVNITDAVSLLNFLFVGGAAPVAPYPVCGPGVLPAEVSCANSPDCQ